MDKPDLRSRLDDLRRVADEVRLQLHLATMEARTYWESDVEPKLKGLERSLEERVEETAEARHAFVDQLGDVVRRVRDEIKSRLASDPPTDK